MKKNLLIAAIAITALASCTSNDFVGDTGPQTSSGTVGAISFTSGTPSVTRATTGATAAGLLNNQFVVFGYKTVSSSDQTVFDNYVVNYGTSSQNTSESNSAGWEYVGYTSKATTSITQSIKYWDLSADTYDFFAYSLGNGTGGESPTYATASVMTNSTYTLTGTQAELGACYISKKKHMEALSTAAREVDLEFVNFMAKIQLKFYETIPGYSVKDVKFYIDGSTKSTGDAANDGLKPALYGDANSIKTGGKYTITFDTDKNPVVGFTEDAGNTQDSKVLFDPVTAAVADPATPAVWLSDYAARDYQEAEATVYLGRVANAATATKQITVLPNSLGVALTLKMDYTLVSRDGTGETILVEGATATIPTQYTAWKSNYAYTYIFKITDDKLIPITLDAIVTETQDGSQETITTVDTPSITTYAKASAVTTDNEYKTNSNIYVVVDKSGTVQSLATTGEGTNAKLYKVTNDTGSGTATQEITEASVANALEHGTKDNNDSPTTWTVTGVDTKDLIVTTVSVPTLTTTTSIPAEDSPTGVAITVNGAKFTPTVAGTYAFEFISRDKATGTYVSGTTYYTAATGDETVDTTGFEEGVTDVSSYYVGDPKKYYKVIKVVAP